MKLRRIDEPFVAARHATGAPTWPRPTGRIDGFDLADPTPLTHHMPSKIQRMITASGRHVLDQKQVC